MKGRRQVQELQRCWVFHAQQFPVCIKNGPPLTGHQANLTQLWEALESTWASISMEHVQYLVESMPNDLRLFWGQKGVQLNIRKVFLMFCTLIVVQDLTDQERDM